MKLISQAMQERHERQLVARPPPLQGINVEAPTHASLQFCLNHEALEGGQGNIHNERSSEMACAFPFLVLRSPPKGQAWAFGEVSNESRGRPLR